MIMAGLAFTDQVPFSTVYLHGLVRDEQGRKMSKTLGNVIDPLEVMDTFGTDALRFTLLTGSTPGNDMNLSLQRVEANRNFANKLWNAGRLVLMSLEDAPAEGDESIELTAADRWIKGRLAQLIHQVDRLFEAYQYGEAGRQIYDFFWSEYADWYLEIAKLQLKQGGDRAWLTAKTMVDILDACLRLLHPFTPYVTEELWGHLKTACQEHAAALGPADGWEEALIVAAWPKAGEISADDQSLMTRFDLLMEIIRAIRNLRSEKNVEARRQIPTMIAAGEEADFLTSQSEVLEKLAHLDADQLEIVSTYSTTPEEAIPLVAAGVEIYLPLAGLLDVEAEKERLTAELKEVEGQISRVSQLLTGPFSEKAPAEVVQKEKDRLAALQDTAAKLEDQLAALS
jgi:valyl-tRNA synthetase